LDQGQKARIATFLKDFKKIVTTGRGLDIIPRPANMVCLAELGLTRKNQREEILALTVSDYCEGPEPDKDRPGEIWVFGKRISGKEVYIKLKIARVGKEKIAKCLSFHPAKHPLCFPFARKERGDKK
jgi:hypothetical protein